MLKNSARHREAAPPPGSSWRILREEKGGLSLGKSKTSIYCISVSADGIKTVIRLPEAVGGREEERRRRNETGKKVIRWGGLAFMGEKNSTREMERVSEGEERNWAL